MVIKYFLPLFCLLAMIQGNMNPVKHRTRRKVVFSKSSKFFFRLNGKDNVINQTNIFAHGWTIRVNWDLPETLPKRHMFFKRNINSHPFKIGNQYIQPEISCMLRILCEISSNIMASNSCGVFCDIARLIKRSQGMETDFFKQYMDNCNYYTEDCYQIYST